MKKWSRNLTHGKVLVTSFFTLVRVLASYKDMKRIAFKPHGRDLWWPISGVRRNILSGSNSCSGLPWWLSGKESACKCRRLGFNPWFREIPWRRKRQPTPVFLTRKSPRKEEPGGLQSMGLQRVGHNLATEQQQQQSLYNIYVYILSFYNIFM